MIRLLTIAAFLLALYNAESHADSTVFLPLGVSVSNSLNDGRAHAWGASQIIEDYKIPFAVGYLNEGHEAGTKRDGVFIQAMGEYHLTSALDTLAFVGPYINANTRDTGAATYKDEYNIALLAGFGLRYKFSDHWSVLGQWQHVITFTNRDSDIFLVGFGIHY